MTFIDDNCIIFDSDDENKFVYTEIFDKFKTLIDNLLETHLKAIESTEDQVGLRWRGKEGRSGGGRRNVRTACSSCTLHPSPWTLHPDPSSSSRARPCPRLPERVFRKT